MRVGVDTSVIVAAVHANHPLHKPTAQWLDAAFASQTVVVTHHSILEAYAVLTRLPGDMRLNPTEADSVLRGTLRGNAVVADFRASEMWTVMTRIQEMPASGGAFYDAFTIELLVEAGVEAIATFNVSDFVRLITKVRAFDPLE